MVRRVESLLEASRVQSKQSLDVHLNIVQIVFLSRAKKCPSVPFLLLFFTYRSFISQKNYLIFNQNIYK